MFLGDDSSRMGRRPKHEGRNSRPTRGSGRNSTRRTQRLRGASPVAHAIHSQTRPAPRTRERRHRRCGARGVVDSEQQALAPIDSERASIADAQGGFPFGAACGLLPPLRSADVQKCTSTWPPLGVRRWGGGFSPDGKDDQRHPPGIGGGRRGGGPPPSRRLRNPGARIRWKRCRSGYAFASTYVGPGDRARNRPSSASEIWQYLAGETSGSLGLTTQSSPSAKRSHRESTRPYALELGGSPSRHVRSRTSQGKIRWPWASSREMRRVRISAIENARLDAPPRTYGEVGDTGRFLRWLRWATCSGPNDLDWDYAWTSQLKRRCMPRLTL